MTENVEYEPVVQRREQRLSIRGVDYCVYEWGDAESPLLIYLHGWGDSGATFQFTVDALQADWRVVAPDWRGFGRSICRCSSYWFPDYLADLHELLGEYSPQGPVRLVGHSMGANVAALYAGVFPERVSAFVNVEGFGLPDTDPVDAPSRYRAWIEAAERSIGFSDYDDLSMLADRIASRHPGIGAPEARFVARQWAAQAGSGRAELRADPRHKLPNPVLYRRAEAQACWRLITAETLLLIGANSRLARGFSRAGDAGFVAAAQTRVIDGAGHMLHFETPGLLAEAVEDFLLPTL